jgi:hypothetical protein
MKMNCWLTSVSAFGLALAAMGQQGPQPPAKATDSGPSLAETMQFIQEKVSQQGQMGWAETISNQPGWTAHVLVNLADLMADPAACTIYTAETVDSTIELPKGRVLKPGGPLTVDDLHTRIVETDTTSFKQVEKVTVETEQDVENQARAEAAHPEITVTVTPTTFFVKLWGSKALISSHTSTTKGKHAPIEKDETGKFSGFLFRDQDTANHAAKALIHAMELCGGGVTKKELF